MTYFGMLQSGTKRDFRSNTGLAQETKKISNDLTLHSKELEKDEQT